MLKKLSIVLTEFLVVIFLASQATASTPILITQPDYDNGITSNMLERGTHYFITSDGYPVLKNQNGQWVYLTNPTPHFITPIAIPLVTIK